MNIEKIIFENEDVFIRHFINSSFLRNYEKMNDNEKRIYHQKIFKLNIEKEFVKKLREYALLNINEPITYEQLGVSFISIRRMCNIFYGKKYYLKNHEDLNPKNMINILNDKIIENLPNFESCFAQTTGAIYYNEYKVSENKKEIVEKALKEQIPYDFIKLLTKFTDKDVLKKIFYHSIKYQDKTEQLTYEDVFIEHKTLEQIFKYNNNKEFKETKEKKFMLISEMLDKMYEEKFNKSEV